MPELSGVQIIYLLESPVLEQTSTKTESRESVGRDFSNYFLQIPDCGHEYLTVNEWGRVSYEELWRSRRVLSVEAVGRGGWHPPFFQVHNQNNSTWSPGLLG